MSHRLAQQLTEWDKQHYLHPTTSPKNHAEQGPKLIFSDGTGIYVNDIHGNQYIDGISMLWNVNLGHGQKELAESAREQMAKLAYSSSFVGYSNEPAIRLAEKLASLAPGDLNTVFYTSGGSESNDTALKLARFYWQLKGQPKKTKIIALERSYHGVTVAAQTATDVPAFHQFSGLKISGVLHAKPHRLACERGESHASNDCGCIRNLIEREGADTIAAVILEPVQGAGGVYLPPEGYLKAVRKLCDEHNILMIADEVICGFGRTGEMFGVDNWGVVPDLMSIAKGITSGYVPLGGVLIRQHIRDTFVQYEDAIAHGFTYSGHPTACAVGLKNIEILERDNIIDHVRNMEQELKKGISYLQDRHSIVHKTRAIGLLAGFELYADRDSETPFAPEVKASLNFVEECFKRRLILRALRANEGYNIVALSPPLTIRKEEIAEMIEIMDDALLAMK